jgi:hypothetical protein
MILVAVVVAGLLPVAVVAVAAVVSERSAVVLADFLGIPVSTACSRQKQYLSFQRKGISHYPASPCVCP